MPRIHGRGGNIGRQTRHSQLVQPFRRSSVTYIWYNFDNLELNYKVTYKHHGVRDLPQVDCLPDNIGTYCCEQIFYPGQWKS